LETDLITKLESIRAGITYVIPELILCVGLLASIVAGLFNRNKKTKLGAWLALITFTGSVVYTIVNWSIFTSPVPLFENMIRSDDFSAFFKILFGVGGCLTTILSVHSQDLKTNKFQSEYYVFLISAVLGAHLLVMSINFLMVFLSLELLSISSYILAGYSFNRKGSEASLKYFLFGSVSSAVMLYGFSILYGISGTLDFSSVTFSNALLNQQTPLLLTAGLLALAGFLYKIAAVPMHVWTPDVYEGAPLPVVAFLSVIPKLAGVAILAKFTLAINLFGQSHTDWQMILAVISLLSISVGNFSALWQKDAKRMMAYSSIAQAGFLLIGIVCFSVQGIQFMLFYGTVYLLANFAVFICLQIFENCGVHSMSAFRGTGKLMAGTSILLLVGLISLAGIPPTAGFTSKLFIFTSLWTAYEQTGKEILFWLLIFGLLNTVVSLFYYLKIPYYAFIKTDSISLNPETSHFKNYLGLILVLVILFLFIQPGLLMGWLNRINFVL
jgi:NADH-quinone oxidoreductase subunit N